MTILSEQEFTAKVLEIAGKPVERFKPFAFHNTDGDCIEFFVSPDDYFAERIDDYLTLYLDMDTEQIVGFVVKNVKRIMDRLSASKTATAFVIDDGKVCLRSLFNSMFLLDKNGGQDRELIVREYVKAVKAAESSRLDEVEIGAVLV